MGFCSSCTNKLPENPEIFVEQEHINNEITLTFVEGANAYLNNGEMKYILINNNIDEVVNFPSDFGVLAFKLEDNKWQRVITHHVDFYNAEAIPVEGETNTQKIDVGHPYEGNHLSFPDADALIAPFAPSIPPDQSVFLRVFVIGTIGEGASVIRVAAYSDIFLRSLVE